MMMFFGPNVDMSFLVQATLLTAFVIFTIVLVVYATSVIFGENFARIDLIMISLFGFLAVLIFDIFALIRISGKIDDLNIVRGIGFIAFENGSDVLLMYIVTILFAGGFIFLAFWKIYTPYFLFNEERIKYAAVAGVLLAPWVLLFMT